MAKVNCVVITKNIKDLANSMPGETPATVAELVALWQQDNNTLEEPTVEQLTKFKNNIRREDSTTSSKAKLENQMRAAKEFPAHIWHSRVSRIASMFSNEIDDALNETLDVLKERLGVAENSIEKAEIDSSLNELSRQEVIKLFTPKGIFDLVKATFEDEVDTPREELIDRQMAKFAKMAKYQNTSEDEIRKLATKTIDYRLREYNKIIDNFEAIAEQSAQILAVTEGILITPDNPQVNDVNYDEDSPDGETQLADMNEEESEESSTLDGWMIKYRFVSPRESLSVEVRKLLRTIPDKTFNGKTRVDDLGYAIYIDPDYAHNVLLEKLSNMTGVEEMIPMLEELSKSHRWVENVIKLVESDETLFSKFYQDFRKDFLPMWIQKKEVEPDGRFTFKTFQVNKPQRASFTMRGWRDNIESGRTLDDDSLYSLNGQVSKKNAKIGLDLTVELQNKVANKSKEALRDLVSDDSFFSDIIKLLRMASIDNNPAIIKEALVTESETITQPVQKILESLNVIYKGVLSNTVKPESDLINTFGGAYNDIAEIIGTVMEDAVEASVREGDKSYQSYVAPSYTGKLIKLLKNVNGDFRKFEAFIESEYKIYDWFYRTNPVTGQKEWLNEWVRLLAEDPDMRKNFNRKVVLNASVTAGKTEYQGWNPLDYLVIMLNEYFSGDIGNENKSKQYGWYYAPILADTQAAKFFKGRKYTNTSGGVDINGNPISFQEQLIDKFENLIIQEYNRINLVYARAQEFKNPKTPFKPIKNFDIVYNEKGEIKNLGGAKFHFLPALNELKDNYYFANGKSFLENLNSLIMDKSDDLRPFLRESITRIMEDGFEKDFKTWSELGLFEESNNGNLQYLKLQGLKKYNQNIAKQLTVVKELMGKDWIDAYENILQSYSNNIPVDDRIADDVFSVLRDYLTEIEAPAELVLSLTTENETKSKMREYYWNSKFATSQIIQLTSTDLAYFKDIDDFQKRNKQNEAVGLKLNTSSKYGTRYERTIYVKDQEGDDYVSSILDDVNEIFQRRVDNGLMLKIDKDRILNDLKNINVTDAQAFRTLKSFRKIMDMGGEWTEDHDRAYDNFKNGVWDMRDYDLIFQPKKPFVYTQTAVSSGIEGKSDMKVPVQHKNSEFLLLAMYDLVGGPLNASPKLRALNEYMDEHDIDVVQFESAVKVGLQGVINLNDVHTKDEIYDRLNSEIYSNNEENLDVLHVIDYEDYGIQQIVPEHNIDSTQLAGTQTRKIVASDISDDAIIEVNGKQVSKKEWLDLYNGSIVENILQSYLRLSEDIKDPVKFNDEIMSEVRSNPRYGADLIRSVLLKENNQPVLPYYELTQSKRIQSLVNSIIKSKITKQKMKGGSLVQVSNYGLTDELQIVFEGEGTNKRIKYVEAYMPWWSRKYFPQLDENKGTGKLDIDAVPEELRKMIAYRIPTEDKYSMYPIYVKGFLPAQSGGAIMLPAEVTKLSGSDFDIDKMYIMMPEFEVNKKVDKRGFVNSVVSRWKSEYEGKVTPDIVNKWKDEINIALDAGDAKVKIDERANDIYEEWLSRKAEFTTKNIKKIKYDMNKAPHEQYPDDYEKATQARNNMIIDLMWGVLTNPDTMPKSFNPGSYDPQKHAASVITLLQTMGKQEAFRHFGANNMSELIQKMNGMSVKKIEELAKSKRDNLDPLSPMTQVSLHQRNMTGAKIISIAANHNSAHALMQHTELALSEQGKFKLNGHEYTSLHSVMNKYAQFISKNMAGYLAASVDNGKDPVLGFLNVNGFTADITFGLIRLGYTPLEVSLFMNQPIVLDITRKYFKESRNGNTIENIITEVLEDYRKHSEGMGFEFSFENYKNNDFLIEDLAEYILIEKDMKNVTHKSQTNDGTKLEFYRKQVNVGLLFQHVVSVTKTIGDLTQALRADSSSGGAGPTIADTQIKTQRYTDFLEDAMKREVAINGSFPLVNYDVIKPGFGYSITSEEIPQLRNVILNSHLPYIQAFHTFGLEAVEDMLKQYFPHFNEPFNAMIKKLKSYTKNGRIDANTLNLVYAEAFVYTMMRTSFFGGETENAAEMRKEFINDFPKKYVKLLKDNPDIADLELVKRITVQKPTKRVPFDTLVFREVGNLSPNQREKYMRDWSSMVYMEKPEAQQLALDLIKYSVYRNGFAFGPSTFIHLAPTLLKLNIPEYVETLEDMMNIHDEDFFNDYVDMFVRNHLDNRKLVTYMDDKFAISIYEKGSRNPVSEFTIVGDDLKTFDKRIIKSVYDNKESGKKVYTFRDWVAFPHAGGFVYYKKHLSTDSDASYMKVEPLGLKNNFIEYEYNVNPFSEITSVIPREFVKGMKEDTSYVDDSFDPIEDDNGYGQNYSEYQSYAEPDILDAVGKVIWGKNWESDTTPISSRSLNEYSPNTDFVDDNNEQIC